MSGALTTFKICSVKRFLKVCYMWRGGMVGGEGVKRVVFLKQTKTRTKTKTKQKQNKTANPTSYFANGARRIEPKVERNYIRVD
jgi:hypothetical protein